MSTPKGTSITKEPYASQFEEIFQSESLLDELRIGTLRFPSLRHTSIRN